MQPQGGALECAEMSVCACRGRRQEERVTESDKEKEHEGERRGVIFRHSRVCAESRAVEISNWPPHFPVASLPLTWSAGDYWKILGVRLLFLILGSNNACRCIYLDQKNWKAGIVKV